MLTDATFHNQLPAADRKLLSDIVPWTRIVSERKTTYREDVIDLVPFILQNRERLTLRPNDDAKCGRVFEGPDTTPGDWERALRTAFQSPYVVQERTCFDRQSMPFFLHGDLTMKDVDIVVRPQLSNGKLNGASAAIETSALNSAT